MKIQIVIKQGKETETYEVFWEKNTIKGKIEKLYEFNLLEIVTTEKKRVFIGEELIKNSIIEF